MLRLVRRFALVQVAALALLGFGLASCGYPSAAECRATVDAPGRHAVAGADKCPDPRSSRPTRDQRAATLLKREGETIQEWLTRFR